MSAVPSHHIATQPTPSDGATCQLGDLADEIRCSRANSAADTVYDSDVICSSIVMVAGELRSSYQHGADAAELQQQLGNLLYQVSEFAVSSDLDVEAALEGRLSRLRASRCGSKPHLRQVQ